MNHSGDFAENRDELPAQEPSALKKAGGMVSKAGNVLGTIGTWLFRLRKVFMAIPVLYFAVRLALENLNSLPEEVGLVLLSSGEFAQTVTRELAVFCPLGITAACLLLMFCSRRALYPWVISIFTLVLPLLLRILNLYPA